MNKFSRGVAIFALGGVLGTGLGVALGFFFFPMSSPPPAAAEQLAAAKSFQARCLRHLHSCQPI